MAKVTSKRSFFELFATNGPVLKVKFDVNGTSPATELEVENRLEKTIDAKGLEKLKRICTNNQLHEFIDFYTKCNGFSLATPVRPANAIKKPLLTQFPVGQLERFTEQYLPKGKLAWMIDLNKTKSLYRGEHKWLAFAEVDGGPACLTIFLEGEHAGGVFLANPQPHFNTLKPIAKSFGLFLQRVAANPAALFKLTRAYVTIISPNGHSLGYLPVEYIDSGGIVFPDDREKAELEFLRGGGSGQGTNGSVKPKWWKIW